MTCPGPAELTRAHAEGLAGDAAAHVAACQRCALLVRQAEELRALARDLPFEDPSPEQLREQGRVIVARSREVRPGRRIAFPAAAAAAAAIAAVAAAWVLRMEPPPAAPSPPPVAVAPSPSVPAPSSRAHLLPSPHARFEHVTKHAAVPGEPSEEIVRLTQGEMDLQVEHLAADERFLVRTGDAEVEVRGTRFMVKVDRDHLQAVAVTEGKVEVRALGKAPVLLLPGDRWARPETPAPRPARGGGVVAAPPPPEEAPVLVAPDPVAAAPTPEPKEPEPTEAERSFAAGWESLRSGDPGAAARSFAAVPGDDAVGEEAAYWRIVAEARSGDRPAAASAMESFLGSYPDSARAGEVSLMLGLQKLEAGREPEARQLLERAARDPAPGVSAPARQALER